jgi:hypothetical protein
MFRPIRIGVREATKIFFPREEFSFLARYATVSALRSASAIAQHPK